MLRKKFFNVFVLVIFITTVLLSTVSTPAFAGSTPTPCPNGDCGGNWDKVCGFDGHNFVRHDALGGSEFTIGDPTRQTVYEFSWEGSDGNFTDGLVRIVAILDKGQMLYKNGFTLNGYCYFGTSSQVQAYLSSGQAGHVDGLLSCTGLTKDYIPVVSVDPSTGAITFFVNAPKGPSVEEIQRHLVPMTQSATKPALLPTATQVDVPLITQQTATPAATTHEPKFDVTTCEVVFAGVPLDIAESQKAGHCVWVVPSPTPKPSYEEQVGQSVLEWFNPLTLVPALANGTVGVSLLCLQGLFWLAIAVIVALLIIAIIRAISRRQ